MDTKGRLIAGSHNRNEFVLINADEIGRVSAVRNLIFLLVWLPSLKLSFFFLSFFLGFWRWKIIPKLLLILGNFGPHFVDSRGVPVVHFHFLCYI